MAQTPRAHERYDVRLSADYRRVGGQLHTVKTKNVSVGGAALETGHVTLHEGEEIELWLFLVVEGVEEPDKPPLEVSARVQWVGEGDDGSHLAGVRFERISPEQKQWLERFLQVSAH
jgi:c-di-GMP-binding flagellar brake protein YcgR